MLRMLRTALRRALVVVPSSRKSSTQLALSLTLFISPSLFPRTCGAAAFKLSPAMLGVSNPSRMVAGVGGTWGDI